MIPIKMSEIARATQGQLVGEDVLVHEINTDTRKSNESCLFVALKGANFNAHVFLEQAVNDGAIGLVVEQQSSLDVPQVIVKDTRNALGQISQLIREKSTAKVIGLTGSVGKTSVKEMIASILNHEGETLSTLGNLNNEIGVPLTLLRLTKEHEFAVVEMGANHPGEIRYTTELVRPDVALINNVAAAHLEGFGDLQGVAEAKGEIYEGLNAKGTAIINVDDNFANYWRARIGQKKVTFGIKNEADIFATSIDSSKPSGVRFHLHHNGKCHEVSLAVPGRHNVMNALAATAACLSIGISIENIVASLRGFTGVKGRLEVHRPSDELVIIDDSYNANYTSLAAAIDVLTNEDGLKILALGDMGELGDEAREYHHKAGVYAKESGVDLLLTIGVLSHFAHQAFKEGAYHFATQKEMVDFIIEKIKNKKTAVLLKGSRSAHMEDIVTPILKWTQQNFEGAC
ncbi:UDP-N-acetylmuramoyl-tripeptide--D-alanyl-D-alanine ligase [Pleionea sediminis]|uniref:UDP-N-acetylmuramoyl-tripeptide--D-alanyl-D- alanine ligase n=1 Tax=Pleionea sediminis TaxID=2569479 RepID=UPI001185D096|nr:UDP-N-acetylmuramoyl-tripeptide--D-alanyl-D-alanine ligase [Pleionea sediminis]